MLSASKMCQMRFLTARKSPHFQMLKHWVCLKYQPQPYKHGMQKNVLSRYAQLSRIILPTIQQHMGYSWRLGFCDVAVLLH